MYITRSDTAKSGWKLKLICRDLYIAVLSCATLYAVGRAVFPCKSPQEIFQEDVGLPAPPSMQLFERKSQNRIIWTHFKVSSADLEVILNKGEYVADHNPEEIHMLQYGYIPSWWKVKEIPGMRVYTHQFHPHGDSDHGNPWDKFILVNPRTNDVYYEYIITGMC